MSINIRTSKTQNGYTAEWSLEIPFITTAMLFDGPNGRYLDRFRRAVDIMIASGHAFSFCYTKLSGFSRVRMHVVMRHNANTELDAINKANSSYSTWVMATRQLVPAIPMALNEWSWMQVPSPVSQMRVTRQMALAQAGTTGFAHPLHWTPQTLETHFNFLDIFSHLEPNEFMQCRISFVKQQATHNTQMVTRAMVESTPSFVSTNNIDRPFDVNTASQSAYASLFDFIELQQSTLSANLSIVLIASNDLSNQRTLQQLNQLLPPRRYFVQIPAFVPDSATPPTATTIFSHELARFIMPPLLLHDKQRLANFSVRDAMIPMPPLIRQNGTITLGTIYDSNQETTQSYRIDLQDFNNHILISGTTGSGKTTTIKSLLQQLVKQQVPFIVFDPLNKQDYRTLQKQIPQLQIYTVGNKHEHPLCFNPFVIGANMSVAGHISLMMGVFRSAFDLEAYVLDAVFEQSMFDVYESCGLDKDAVIQHDMPYTFPTFAQYEKAIQKYLTRLGADIRNARQSSLAELKQAIERRITTIQQSLGSIISSDNPPIDELLRTPCILELGSIGDPARVHFVLGMLLMRIFEEVMATGRASQLKCVLVLEEAHRFMSKEDKHDHTVFEQLLAEARGYGLGIMVADQMPGLLIPGVIGNTNLKIIHRLDDQTSITNLTNHVLDDATRMTIASLTPGHTITIRDGVPAHVKITQS